MLRIGFIALSPSAPVIALRTGVANHAELGKIISQIKSFVTGEHFR
jgi:hypothetical protein